MRRSRLVVLGLVFACAGPDDPGAAETTRGTTTDEAGSSTTTPAPGSTSSTSAPDESTSTTEPAEETAPATDSSSSTATTDSSESTGCTPGEQGCPCDEGACAAGLACLEELCTAPGACEEDLLEPNDEEAGPTLLGEIDDDDDDGGAIFGTLDGPDDVDWYRYTGNDTLLGNVDPARFVKADGGIRLCKFAECLGGVELTEFDCPAETEPATSPLGRPGCCAPMGIALGDANCTGGLDDDMQVFLRVDQAQAQCTAYELIYHF